MSLVFISHSSEDKELADELKGELEAWHYEWLFLSTDIRQGIRGSELWEKKLYDKLRESDAVIAVCTKNFAQSCWCFAEITHASKDGKPIFPLRYEPWRDERRGGVVGWLLERAGVVGAPERTSPTAMSAILAPRQEIDLTGDRQQGYEKLLNDLKDKGVRPEKDRRWTSDKSPYRGLKYFEKIHAPIFFGREEFIRDGKQRVNKQLRKNLILVVGASGSGKSSLVRAGILPQLGDQRLVVGPFLPGQEPLKQLAESLAAASKGKQEWGAIHSKLEGKGDPGRAFVQLIADLKRDAGRPDAEVLLVIDQFEELLGYQDAEHEANCCCCLKMLRAGLEAKGSALLILATMRSDYLAAFQADPVLRDLDFDSLLLRSMSREDMERVIEGPAALAGIELKKDLVKRLLDDTAELDALPLLSFILREMWDRYIDKDHRTLEIGHYNALGGLKITVESAAKKAMKQALALGKGTEEELSSAFLELARLAKDSSWVSRPVRWKDFSGDVRAMLDCFVKRRLLTVGPEIEKEPAGRTQGQDTVRVAHEVLFSCWDQLDEWLTEFKPVAVQRRKVQGAANEWDEKGRKEGYLWRGAQFEAAQKFQGDPTLSSLESEFLRASDAAEQERRRVAARANLHEARRLIDGRQRRLALAHLARALRLAPDEAAARGGVLDSLLRVGPLIPSEPLRHQGWVLSAAFSADGRRVVTESVDRGTSTGRRMRLWDATVGGEESPASEVAVAATPPDVDGRWVIAGCRSAARLWDAAQGEPADEELLHREDARWVQLSPDGRRVLTVANDRTARVWDAATGEPVSEPLHGKVLSASFSPDGQRVVTGSKDLTARVWDVAPRQPLAVPLGHEDGVVSASFSPDGRRVVTVSEKSGLMGRKPSRRLSYWSAGSRESPTKSPSPPEKSAVRVWNAVTGRPVSKPLKHGARVVSASFSTDGRRLITVTEDGKALQWDAATGKPAGKPRRYGEATVRTASFSPDGQWLMTSTGSTAQVWGAAAGTPVGKSLAHGEVIYCAAFSRDGLRIATGSADGTARVWEAATGEPLGAPLVHEGQVHSVSFSPAGRRLVTATDNQAQVWDPETGKVIGAALRHESYFLSAAFSPDGRWVVTAGKQTARLWDAATGRLVGEPLPHGVSLSTASFAPDSRRVVVACNDRTARIWDVLIGSPAESRDLAELAEAVGGYRLTEYGNVEPIPSDERAESLAALRRAGERALESQPTVAAFIGWYFTPRSARTLSPLSKMKAEEYLRRLLALKTQQARQEAERNFPGHPLLVGASGVNG